jgi:hypothetical protein
MKRQFAIGIIESKKIVSVPHKHFSLRMATGFVKAYNRHSRRYGDKQRAVILVHPLMRAIRGLKETATLP